MRVARLLLGAVLAAGVARGEALRATDRVLVLAPHPDDEIIGCAGLVQDARAAGAAVRIVFLTHGDANELAFLLAERRPVFAPRTALRMGELRHGEAIAAARALGLGAHDLQFLGYPDAGTLDIFTHRWRDATPARSLLTGSRAVPYADALHPGAPYVGESVLGDLERVLREFAPTVVAVSHPADGNVDHQALYLFTRVALWDLAPSPAPRLLPYLVHYRSWPRPDGLHPDVPLVPPAPLDGPIAWLARPLDAAARQRKATALAAHASQIRYSGDFLRSFVRANELFGDYPPLRPDGDLVRVEGDAMELVTPLARPLGEAADRQIYLIGYRRGRAFADMPKLRIDVGPLGHDVFDGDRRLERGTATVSRTGRAITVRLPLAALGDPDHVLTQTRSALLAMPLGERPWREIALAR